MTTKENFKPCEGCDMPRRVEGIEQDVRELEEELHRIRDHERRQDKLLMGIQMELRAGNKAVLEKLSKIVDLLMKGR